MKKYQNKYRVQSARLQSWDYGSSALYFITICTQNRVHHFGQIIGGEMQLSEIGEIVKNEWLRTFDIRPDMNLYMGEYMVMPNHFHAVLGIGINQYNDGCDGCGCCDRDGCGGRDRDASRLYLENGNENKNGNIPREKRKSIRTTIKKPVIHHSGF